MNSKKAILIGAFLAVSAGGFVLYQFIGSPPASPESSESNIMKVTMYKSPTCGCCVQHAAYLEEHGFEVDVVKAPNMTTIKDQYNIPSESESCHTTIIDGYVVEGHVPIEAIDALLVERPDIDGIALPNMPSGSPGMPGAKQGPFAIQSLTDGTVGSFMSL